MTMTLPLKLLGGTLASGSLVSAGAGGYLLLSEDSEKTVEIKRIEDRGRVITNLTSKGSWTSIVEYSDAKLWVSCTGQGDSKDAEVTCTRKIKISDSLWIDLEANELTYGELGKDEYKFIYRERIEEEDIDYRGQCDSNSLEEKDNPCSKANLPEGWTIEKVIK